VTYRRTLVALALVVVAVAVPSAAWFLAGQRQLANELQLREKSARIKTQKMGVVLAERLATRFELLRENESRRPFYHYQNLFHDPEAAAQGVSVSPSPLARGPADPLIAAHFQVDGDGVLSLPTINDELPELGSQSTDGAHCDILEALEGIAFFCLEETVFGNSDLYDPRSRSESFPNLDVSKSTAPHVEQISLPLHAWRQHLEANALYADLKYAQGTQHKTHALATADAGQQVQVAVWPFSWRTLPVSGEPGLVALRKIETPVGVWIQGFVIDHQTVLRQHLTQTDYAATLAPLSEIGRNQISHQKDPDQVVSRISGTPWGIALDASEVLGKAAAEVTSERGRFVSLFLLGAMAAGIAGLLVVTMVYQSERLALQRAQFAASAAHELRTPLAGLRLYGEMLAEGLGNPARTQEYARRMASEAERLGRVVTNVLSFTHLERESLSVHPQSGDLSEAVETAYERQRPALEASGARLEVDFPEGLPPVTFDRDAVAHIVQNLLENAEKYTREIVDREICLSLSQGQAGVVLTVADNGEGIAQKVQRRLFRPFSRGRHSDAEGLGLGLVLVKALAKAQGGDVRYRDRSTGGAEFTVTFAS
jgi:signal transduction histidine kinase